MLVFRFLIVGLALCPFLSFSQKNFFEGYVVTLQGDTLKGLVEGKEIGNTLTQALFKPNPNAAVQRFSKKDCIAFGLYNRDFFELHTVNITMSKLGFADLSTGVDTASKREAVFLQVLQKGKNITLYTFTDDIKTRYYVKEEADLEPIELVYNRFYNPKNTTQIVDSPKFQRQLQVLFRKYGVEIQDYQLERSQYTQYDILKLVSMVNNYQKEKSKYKTFTLYAGIGLAHLSTSYFGDHRFTRGGEASKTSTIPFVTVGIDIYANPAYGRAFFRIETSFFAAKHEIEAKPSAFIFPAATHQFKQFVGTVSTSFLYNFYRINNYKLYVGAGIAARYAHTSDNITIYKYTTSTVEVPGPDFRRLRIQVPVSAGVVLSKRADIAITYTRRTVITDNYGAFGIRATQFKAGLNYRF